MISWVVALLYPNLILLEIESENKNGSWGTKPIAFLKSVKLISLIGMASIVIRPLFTSYSLETKFTMLDFPAPVLPRKATVSPFFTEKLMFFNASILVSS